jgi:hypothetical protein
MTRTERSVRRSAVGIESVAGPPAAGDGVRVRITVAQRSGKSRRSVSSTRSSSSPQSSVPPRRYQ